MGFGVGMAQVHLHIPSFNAGELSPLLGARFAVEKVQAGCRKLRNFVIHTHGPAFRRPGMEDVGAAKSDEFKSRLAGFSFSTTTGFILEFSPDGLQVWSNSELVPLVNEVALPYSETECAELQIEQVNDVCYLVHGNHPPRQLTRYADDDWRLADIDWDWPPLGDENARADAVSTPDVTSVLEVPTEEWPEFIVPTNTPFVFALTTPDTTAAAKTATVQHWSGTAWVTTHTFSWTTSPPASFNSNTGAFTVWRLTYVGPQNVGLVGMGGLYNHTLDTNVYFAAEDSESVVVPAGQWQAVVACSNPLPAGATLWLQKKTGSTFANYIKMTLRAGDTIETRLPALAMATEFRFNWTGRAMAGTAALETLVFPVVEDITLECSNTNGEGRTLTASAPLFRAGHEGSYWQITHRRENSAVELVAAVTTISEASSSAITITGKWDVFTYGTWAATLYLERKIGATWETVRSWTSKKDRNVIANGEETEPAEMRLRVSAGTSEAATGAAVPRFVLECSDSRVNGLVKITAIGTLDGDGKATEATVDIISGLFSTDPTAIWSEGAFSAVHGYPRAVALHQGRLWFGGVAKEPCRLWGSVSNDFTNFRRSSFDDGSISVSPATQRSNAIQWLASFERDLIVGTKGDEWTLGATGDVIKPTDIQMLRRSSYGSAYSQAVQVGDALVFPQRGNKRLRQISPRSDAQQWSAVDLTVLAEHVGQYGFTAFAMMSSPMIVLWTASGDGKLLGMTFEREQNVFGWHVHETDGTIESVAVVAAENADELWLSVLRSNGRRIERLDSLTLGRDFSNVGNLMYLDSARRFDFTGSPSAALTGLDHLEGRTVSILADGVEQTPAAVTGGALTLAAPATTVIVGLPFTSELQPMRMDIPLRDGTAQNRRFRVSRVGMYLHSTRGGEVAEHPTATFEAIPQSKNATYTGDAETVVSSRARDGVDVILRQTKPFPLNVGSITVKADVYGE